MSSPFLAIFRTSCELSAVLVLLTTQAVRTGTHILAAIPGDVAHQKCLKNAGPACGHQDCPLLECHPGVHDLEERYPAPQTIAA